MSNYVIEAIAWILGTAVAGAAMGWSVKLLNMKKGRSRG